MSHINEHVWMNESCHAWIKMCGSYEMSIEGGEDALNCRSFSAKEPLVTGLFC